MSTVKVSTVEFRKNIYKYLDKLPIEVVSKGKTVFFVIKELSTLGGQNKNSEVSTVEMRKEVNKDEVELAKQEKLDKAREVLANITKNSKAPIFCPKHGASRIGGEYTCGCQI